MPLGLLDGDRLGLGGVEGVEGASRLGAVHQQRGHALGVRLDPRRQGHALLDEGAGGGAGGQVELAGLVHDAPIVDDEVVGHGQLVLGVAAVQAAHHLRLGALELLAHLAHRLLVHHRGVVRRVLGKQVAWQVLLEPLVLSGGNS